MSDPRARPLMIKYMSILQGIESIQMVGFANLLDTATTAQIEAHEKTVAFLESEIARAKSTR